MSHHMRWRISVLVLAFATVVPLTDAQAISASSASTGKRVVSACGSDYPLAGMNVPLGNDALVGYTRTTERCSLSLARSWPAPRLPSAVAR